ncbi:MAG: SusD/RagB family nutrient-binding outer membrane lipoprotein [Chitinophagaceae bacterium]|nr:SusD/RagB family nutrient-binding outer membrane lipoprotein [Chitinophagaceae bacterium]
MKKYLTNIFYTASALTVVLFTSCEKKLDEAFPNPNAQVKQPIESLLPGIIANMVVSHSANGTLYGTHRDGQYIGKFIQYWETNSTLNRQDQMSDWFGTSTPDLMGDIWAMHYYGHGQNIERMIEWGTEEKKWDYVGVAQAIRAWGWLTLTDVTDDVILYEAFNPAQLVFKYDPQSEVYKVVRRLCMQALDNLNKTGDGVNQANLAISDAYFNNGDMEKWKRFVYGVMARTYNRYTNKGAEYKPDSVIYWANKYLEGAGATTNLRITWSNDGGSGTYNWYSPFRGNIGTFRQSKFIADLMMGDNSRFTRTNIADTIDPRAWYIIRENPNSTFKGIRPNKGTDGLPTNDQPANYWGGAFSSTTAPSSDAGSRYIFKNKALWPMMTASEMHFLKAEAYYRKADKPNALTSYIAAINSNFDHLIANYEESVPAANKITPAKRTVFFDNPTNIPSSANLTLSHIMLQKYIAMYGWGFIETWVDMRRFHYTDNESGQQAFKSDGTVVFPQSQQVYADFTPPTGTDLYTGNNAKWIYRERPRYNSEYLYNVAELNRLGAFASDYITKPCWFSEP